MRANDVLSCSYGPLDCLHSLEPAGPVGFAASLQRIKLRVCIVAKWLGIEMREVVPLPERPDVVRAEWLALLGYIPWVLVDL